MLSGANIVDEAIQVFTFQRALTEVVAHCPRLLIRGTWAVVSPLIQHRLNAFYCQIDAAYVEGGLVKGQVTRTILFIQIARRAGHTQVGFLYNVLFVTSIMLVGLRNANT